MHAGMHAAEAIYERLSQGADCRDLSNYQEKIEGSQIEKDLHRSRNMRQVFSKGFFVGGAAGVRRWTSRAAASPAATGRTHDDASVDVFIGKRWKKYPKPDGKYTFDKLSSVFATGNQSRDDAPSHIRIKKKVPLELGLMWQQMCPAQVYEVPEEILEQAAEGRERRGRSQAGDRDRDRAVELRAVRRHHRQGRTPDSARGRRGPELPADLAR